jgi:LytS/YehU family sensor histidine kinase
MKNDMTEKEKTQRFSINFLMIFAVVVMSMILTISHVDTTPNHLLCKIIEFLKIPMVIICLICLVTLFITGQKIFKGVYGYAPWQKRPRNMSKVIETYIPSKKTEQ